MAPLSNMNYNYSYYQLHFSSSSSQNQQCETPDQVLLTCIYYTWSFKSESYFYAFLIDYILFDRRWPSLISRMLRNYSCIKGIFDLFWSSCYDQVFYKQVCSINVAKMYPFPIQYPQDNPTHALENSYPKSKGELPLCSTFLSPDFLSLLS